MPTTHSKPTHKPKRKGFCEWFRDTINKGIVEGLVWLDDEKTEVRVPWKRVDKPGFHPNDAKLFKLYAEHTEKYRPGDLEDPSTWKTRFRCALRKMTEIVEQKDKCDLEGDVPYRTFKFVEKKSIKDHGKKIKLPHPITHLVKRRQFCNERLSQKPSTPNRKHQFHWSTWPDNDFDSTSWRVNAVPSTTDEYFPDWGPQPMQCWPALADLQTQIPDLDCINKDTLLGSKDHVTDQSVREATQWLLKADLTDVSPPYWSDCQYAELTYGMIAQECSVSFGQYQ